MSSPTMADIARAAGVSKMTVSLALRRDPQLPEATRARIAALAERLGYRRDPVLAELMARLRRSGRPRFQATLALINAHPDPEAFRRHPTVPVYVEGCRRQASALGYALDTFWLHEPAMDGRRLAEVFAARGIRGAVIVGLMEANRLPPHFTPVVERFPCVVTGVRTRDPALSFACVDHHIVARRAVEQALAIGYRRPALVLDREIDDLVEGRFSSGFAMGQQVLPRANRLKPFHALAASRRDPARFRSWLERARPDVVFALYNAVGRWIEASGRRIPRDIGFIQLEWRAARPDTAGMNQHNDIVGEAAIDMLAGMIQRGESGAPSFPRATLIGPTWVDGRSVRRTKLVRGASGSSG